MYGSSKHKWPAFRFFSTEASAGNSARTQKNLAVPATVADQGGWEGRPNRPREQTAAVHIADMPGLANS